METKEKLLGKVSITPEGEYDVNKEYDRLSLVSIKDKSQIYVSRKKVPSNVSIQDEEYWIQILDYNPKSDEFNKRIAELERKLNILDQIISTEDNDDNGLPDGEDRIINIENDISWEEL